MLTPFHLLPLPMAEPVVVEATAMEEASAKARGKRRRYVEESEESKSRTAGAGLTDND